MGRIEQLAQEITKGKLNFLFIGPGGAGKTHAAAMLCPPTLFLDTEGGLRTVIRLNTGARAITIPQSNPWEFLIDILPELLTQDIYPTICLDSITGLSDLLFKQVENAKPDKAEKSILRNYGLTIDRLKQLVYKLNSAKAHVIYVAQEATSTDDQGNVQLYIPNVAGKETFARQLPALVDEVWFFSTKIGYDPKAKARTTSRVILTAPSGQRIGKDRDGILNVEEELDFDLLRKKLNLEREEVLITQPT